MAPRHTAPLRSGRTPPAPEPGALPDPAAQVLRKPGRPRSTDCCEAIRDATLELLVERGFAETSIESIAARAGVGKTTVYRRWPNKADLVVHAFFETVGARVRIGDSGDLRADFRQQMRLVVKQMAGPSGRAFATILACMQMDATLAEAFRTRWLAVRRAEGRSALVRGIERGEIPAGTDPDFVLDALYSPIHFRLLAEHAPLSTAFSDRIVELVFDGLGASRGRSARTGAPPRKRAARSARPRRSTKAR